jgi:hypothetical protein
MRSMYPWGHAQPFVFLQACVERWSRLDTLPMVSHSTWLHPTRLFSGSQRKTSQSKRANMHPRLLFRETSLTTRAGTQPALYASVSVGGEGQVCPNCQVEESVHRKVHKAKQEEFVSSKYTPEGAYKDRFRPR